MLWAHPLCSANGTAGENAMCSRQVMWLPLLGGGLLAAAWEEQPTPSNLRVLDGWQLAHFCMMLTYKTFSFAFSVLKASYSGDLHDWSCKRQDLSLSSVTSPASFCLCLIVFLLWCAHRLDGFIHIMKVEKVYPGERKHSINTTLWFEGNKVQDWIRACSASIAVMWKRGHCDFALLFILHAVNPTIHLQFEIAERKNELDWFVIRWTWKLWWCVAFPSTLKPKHCGLTLCVLLNSLLHLPGGCSRK